MIRRWTWAGALVLALFASGCISEQGDSDTDDPEPDAAGDTDGGADADGAGDGDAAVESDQGAAPDMAPPDEPDAAPPLPACEGEDSLGAIGSAETAAAIEPGFERDDLFLCPESQDWFRVTLAAGQQLRVQLAAEPPENDLDVAVLGPDGMLVDESAGDTGEEALEITAPAAGDHFVRVTGYRDTESAYALSVTSGCRRDEQCPADQVCNPFEGACEPFRPAACGRDAYEPNDRDAEAMAVEPGVVEGVLCGADRDWFALVVEGGTSLELLAGIEGGRDIDVFVVDPSSGRYVGAAVNGPEVNPERLSLRHLPAGRYLVGLLAPTEGRDSDAAYRLEIVGRSGGCAIDRDCTDALPVCDAATGICGPAGGDVPLGGRCAEDEDCAPGAEACYAGGAGGHDNFCTITCESDDQCSDIEGGRCVRLGRRTQICAPACRSDDDCSAFRTCADGVCDLRGECADDDDCEDGEVCRAERFGMLCSLAPPPPDCGMDEGREPNNGRGQATAVEPGVYADLRVCDADDDWYRVTVPPEAAAQVLAVRVAFRPGVDIDVYITDATGNDVGAATSADRNEEVIEARFIAPGEYFIRIDQFSSDRLEDTVYTLTIELVPNEDRCTVAGGECNSTDPLRIVCDEMTGACSPLVGAGMVGLGERCDSQDDCSDDAEACWTFEGGADGRNICTHTCENDRDCGDVPDTTCVPFPQAQVAVCLPGE